MHTLRLIFSAGLLLALSLPALGQYSTKTIDKTYALPAGKKAELNLRFGRTIKINTWNRRELTLKTIIKRSNESMDEIHQLVANESAELLRIVADFKFKDNDKRNYQCWNCENPQENCLCFEVSYELFVPADAELSLETISGDVEAIGLRGPVRIKSIAGFVDLGLPAKTASSLSFRSVTGEIYTDFDLDLDENSTAYAKRLNAPLNGGGPRIEVETVSGDIYFRKKE